jgi:hypothetical protein
MRQQTRPLKESAEKVVRDRRRHTGSVRITSSLRADIIFRVGQAETQKWKQRRQQATRIVSKLLHIGPLSLVI